jgi:hypothetical protein
MKKGRLASFFASALVVRQGTLGGTMGRIEKGALMNHHEARKNT